MTTTMQKGERPHGPSTRLRGYMGAWAYLLIFVVLDKITLFLTEHFGKSRFAYL